MVERIIRAKIPVEQLKIGMFVADLDRPWVETPFTVHGFPLTDNSQIKQLQLLCKYVYIKTAQAKLADTTGQAYRRVEYHDRNTPIKEALPRAQKAYSKAKSVVSQLYSNTRLGQSFDTQEVKAVVSDCVDSIIENPNAMLWLGLLRDVDEYTAEHSLNVALLSIIIGRAEGLAHSDLELLGLSGMLHDIGKAQVPEAILNKPGALTDDEFAIMKSHTSLGYRMLKEKNDLPTGVADVAHSHHERLNGRGYPKQLDAKQIPYFSRIVAVADTYDAITSERCYSSAKSSLEGLQILMGSQTTHFDPNLVERLVDCIGIYPAGSLAELSTGEIAIILPTAKSKHHTPRVLVVRNKQKQDCEERMIDLSKDSGPDAGTTIKNLLSDGLFGINVASYHEQGSTLLTS